MWNNPLYKKTWLAGAAVAAYRFMKFGADDNHVIQADAATDGLLGVSDYVGSTAAEDPCEPILIGVGEIELAATLARGQEVTSDANGKAVAAASGNTVGGKLLQSGVAGDVVPILLHAAGDSEATPLYHADVTVSTAELLALNATPKQLVAAPGAGNILVLEFAQLWLDFATTAYDGIAAGEDLTVKYTDASGVVAATVETTGFLDGTADETRYVKAASAAAVQPVANAALVLHLLSDEIATGDSPLKVRTWYRVVPETWS